MRRGIYCFFRLVSPFSLCVAAFVLFGCCSVIQGQARTLVSMLNEAVVDGDLIYLGNVSKVSAPDGLTDRLNSISLGYAPAIGMTREISRSQIQLSIAAAGFTHVDFTQDSPAKILVRHAGQNVSTLQIREAVEKAVIGHFAGGNVSAQILRLEVPDSFQVPIGTLEIKASLANVRNVFERFSIPVEIRVDRKLFRSLAVSVEIAAFAEVLVSATDLAVNKRVGEADARFEKVRLEKPLTSYVRDKTMLRGLQLVKTVEHGRPITSDLFVDAVVVRFGDPVRIEARLGRIKIVISGEARAGGKIGDHIAVKNKQSGTIMQAVVVDEGLVKVTF